MFYRNKALGKAMTKKGNTWYLFFLISFEKKGQSGFGGIYYVYLG